MEDFHGSRLSQVTSSLSPTGVPDRAEPMAALATISKVHGSRARNLSRTHPLQIGVQTLNRSRQVRPGRIDLD
jgi:hypothetical protein